MTGVQSLLRRTALTSVIVNVGIVITGGAVRLTGSGLGCPTWPQCTDDSYTPTSAMGINATVEFGNRMLTFVVGVVAVAGVVLALRQRVRDRRVVRLAVLVLLGVGLQALVGGLTVRTQLNPEVVGGHFLISVGLISVAYAFWRSTDVSVVTTPAGMAPGTDGPRSRAVPRPLRVLAGILTAASLAVIVVGTLVTGSGPHAGDANARRNNLDPQIIAQVHADLVFLIIGLAVATWFGLRAIKDRVPSAPAASIDAASVRVAWLIGILAAQGAIGLVQYFTNLPVLLVGAHMAGACAVWLATLSVLYATRAQSPPDATVGDTATLAPASAVTGTLVAAQIAPSHP